MEQREQIEFTDFGRILWHHRRAFLFTGIISAVLGLIIAFLVPVYYQSTATVFPAAISYVESTDLVYRRGNINEFGDTEQAEQLLELFASRDFQEKIIKQTKLYEHYKINPEASRAKFKVYQRYQELITAKRSRYNAINISVKDRSPEKAAEIVNTVIAELDNFRNQVIRERIKSHTRTLESSRDSLNAVWGIWTDSLLSLQKKGVVGQEERAALLESQGNVRGNAEEVQKRIEANFQYGAQFDIVEREVDFIQSQINTVDKILLQWKTNAAEGISQQFVFEHGHIPDKKHSPKRLFILLGTIGFALLLLLFYLYGRQNWPAIRKRLDS